MRKIEANLIEAIRTNREWSEGNTTFAGGLVLLHGHVIAKKDGTTWMINLQGYNTNVTRNRLTAILREFSSETCGVFKKNGKAYLQMRNGYADEISTEGWHNA
jgi:hypothetical protein